MTETLGTVEGWRNHCASLQKDLRDLHIRIHELEETIRAHEIERDLLIEVHTATVLAISRR